LEREVNLIVRTMEQRDLDAVLAIQAASPEIAQWTLSDYQLVGRANMPAWVAEENNDVVGFLVARQILDELEILNLAVRPDVRRRGAGSLLLREALASRTRDGTAKAYLEVRASNVAACQFYKRHDFVICGRRAQYYAAPLEDALLLECELRVT
jgi:ribosomal-protein-alanine N-acetyltransferase